MNEDEVFELTKEELEHLLTFVTSGLDWASHVHCSEEEALGENPTELEEMFFRHGCSLGP